MSESPAHHTAFIKAWQQPSVGGGSDHRPLLVWVARGGGKWLCLAILMKQLCNRNLSFTSRCKLVDYNIGDSGKVGRDRHLEFPLHDYVRGLSHAAAQYRVVVLFNGGTHRRSCISIHRTNGKYWYHSMIIGDLSTTHSNKMVICQNAQSTL